MAIMQFSFGLCFMALVATSTAVYDGKKSSVLTTPATYDKDITNSPHRLTILEFFAPWCGHCQRLEEPYYKAHAILKGIANVRAIDADEHRDFVRSKGFSIRGFPTIMILKDGKDPKEFKGDRTTAGIVKAAKEEIEAMLNEGLGGSSGSSGSRKNKDKDVIELTDSNFEDLVLKSEDMWLVEFFAPWCGHCKNLEPHWASAASELQGKVKLGALDATVHQVMASRYGIQGYPTIKYFAPGKKDSDSVEDYNGGRTSKDIVSWAMDKLSENVKPPEIKQLVGEAVLKEACEEHPLCVLAVLPHILDCQSKCRNAYIDILNAMGEKYKKKMWGWVWSEAGEQPDLESALDIGGFGYPAMAVVNTKKMKYSILRGSFSNDGINEFLRDLSYGRGSTAPVKGASLPKINTVEPWDGKDGEMPQEEEIDLSDVDLDDLSKDEL